MKVKVQRTSREVVEVEIEFPTYRFADWSGDNYTSEHWWMFNGREVWEVSRVAQYRDDSLSWEVKRYQFTIGGSVLDDGSDDVNASSAADFEKALADAAAFIALALPS